ncbi:ATP synthase subunit I [Fonticella tunisiensis]|nr:ATP synthase subunit I [Fonticella tunisiensis]
MLKRLGAGFITAAVISLFVYAFLGMYGLKSYFIGFLLSALNFILLSLELNTILEIRPKRSRVYHLIFFLIRYILIGYVIVQAVKNDNANVFLIFGGLITMNFSIVINASLNHFIRRKVS